jgi:hypothetical protein
MGKKKSEGKQKAKGSQLVIRIEKAEREAFVSLCETLDTTAAREIRRFMRDFVKAHATSQQPEKDAPLVLVTPLIDPVAPIAPQQSDQPANT